MITISKTFSAAGVSEPLYVRPGEDFDYSTVAAGGFAETALLESSVNGGLSWSTVLSGITGSISSTRVRNYNVKPVLYRFRAKQVGPGWAGTLAITLAEVSEDIASNQFRNSSGVVVASATEEGFRADKLTATTSLVIGSTPVTSTAAELNILDGVTASAAELNILDGVTSTTAELNILDGVTSTAAELNILDGVTSSAAELNILDGVTATAAQINTLDLAVQAETIAAGVAASAAKKYTKIDSTPGAGAITLAVPDASMLGSIKTIEMTVDGGDVTLALTNVVGGSAGTTATFANVGEALVLLAATSKWIVLKEYGVVLS